MDNLNYGVIGNCCTAALISEKGSIEWLCFPNFDSPSIIRKSKCSRISKRKVHFTKRNV